MLPRKLVHIHKHLVSFIISFFLIILLNNDFSLIPFAIKLGCLIFDIPKASQVVNFSDIRSLFGITLCLGLHTVPYLMVRRCGHTVTVPSP